MPPTPRPHGIEFQDIDTISAPLCELHAILLDAGALATWNPAFSEVYHQGKAEVGKPIAIRVLRALSGELTYDLVEPNRINMTITVPGLTERNTWSLANQPGRTTQVTHAFSRSGRLARILESRTQGIAQLRIDRLRERVQLLDSKSDSP